MENHFGWFKKYMNKNGSVRNCTTKCNHQVPRHCTWYLSKNTKVAPSIARLKIGDNRRSLTFNVSEIFAVRF